MNKKRALNNAREFIDINIIQNLANHNLNKPMDAIFSNEILEDDPNLEILKAELNKVGFDILPADRPNWWNVTKIK